ncbi:MAG: hypothetical protein C4547_07280 [Phycisphaerales bacterium]|nr:MAG: hypothetical protein C4547_07280 [Phycisphaerales bacterium]
MIRRGWVCIAAALCVAAPAALAGVDVGPEDGLYGYSTPELSVSTMYGGPGTEGGPDVAIVAAAGAQGACQFTDPQAKLTDTGRFASVSIINVQLVTPTLEQLQAFDAIICWTNTTPLDTNAWGDAVADYIDGGGGVVVTVFAVSTTTTNRWIGGRYDSEQYFVIVPRSGNTSTAASLGTIHDPNHPVVQGINTLAANQAFRPTGTTLHQDGVLVASWNDGKVLVAARDIKGVKRVDLGFYPPSNACSANWWTGDGATLMANALEYVAGGGVGCIYTLKKSKAKGGCETCPEVGSDYRTESACETVEDCDKKLKTTIACPEGNGTCKLKGKRSSCA